MEEQWRFLLIDGANDRYWLAMMAEALRPLGTLTVAAETDALQSNRLDTCDLVIVDAAAVTDITRFLLGLRECRPTPKIIVATASPTWTRAREAFKAGATDYIRKSLDPQELRAAVLGALKKSRPS
ncbi:MAG: response regulator [Ardenticatenaceae bacterium]|nr:response regulator [Ardenticatenaceae bacterium]HBY93817.1 hypothetical protein [Chloroflexota bacterium]